MAEKGFDLPTQVDNDAEDNRRGAIEQYQIPEMGADFPRQQTAADFAEEALDRGTVPIDDINETDQKKGPSRRKVVIAGLAAAVGLAAAATFGVKAMNSNEGNNLPPENAPGTSAPQVPGQTETTTSTPEKEAPTAETVEFTVDGQTYKGVNGLIGALGQKLFKDNVPNPKPLSNAEGLAMFTNYMEAVKNAANLKVESGGEAFLKEATDKLLFQEGTNPALRAFINELQKSGQKVTSVEKPGLLGAPDTKYVQGQAYLNVENALGEKSKYFVSGAIFNDFGIYHNDGRTSIVDLREPN